MLTEHVTRPVANQQVENAGAKFREELKAYQEQKRQTAFYKDEAENTGEEAADCSLMQCCQKMLDAGLLVNRFASGARWASVSHLPSVFHPP